MGYLDDLMKEPLVEENKSKKKIEVVDADDETLPEDKTIECPECDNMGAFWWLQQTRAGDEPETKFLKCSKCKHTWRDYS